MTTNYIAELIEDKKYQVTVDLGEDNTVTFFCIVKENESELNALIAFHLEFLNKRPVTYEAAPPAPDLSVVIQEQQALITTLTQRISALEAK